MDKAVADYFEGVLAGGANAKTAANWITTALFSLMNKHSIEREDIGSIKVTPAAMAALVKLVESGAINKGTATTVLETVWAEGGDPAAIVQAKGLAQVSDTSAIVTTIEQVLASQSAMVTRYLGGW